jgi:tRNA-intron endonuclease
LIKPIEVELLQGGHLIIWDYVKGNQLYNHGFYGKPLGISKPRNEFYEPLILDPIEGMYLAEKEIIKVNIKGKEITAKKLEKILQANHNLFPEKYRVYKDLRKKGFIITPGIKFGCDFAVYKDGPGIDHAPYIIQIKKPNTEITAPEIVKASRLATTVRKSFIIAILEEQIRYIEFNWWKA